MIRALLLGAFATSALAAQCTADLGLDACNGFDAAGNFIVQNQQSPATGVEFGFDYNINAAIQYVGDHPWPSHNTISDGASSTISVDPNTATNSHTNRGCTFVDTSLAGDSTTVVQLAKSGGTAEWTCPTGGTHGTVCASGSAKRNYKVSMTMANLVSGLDQNGQFVLYFQRVLANPITGSNIDLKWIAEEACKVNIDVEFSCSGGNCVEVTTIVCASFAGISSFTSGVTGPGNDGVVSIECKVPTGFAISEDGTNAGSAVMVEDTASAATIVGTNCVDPVTSAAVACTKQDVWAGPVGDVTNSFVCSTGSAGGGVCSGTVVTAIPLRAGENFVGALHVDAYVSQGGGAYTLSAERLHTARYNLTRASTPPPVVFSLPVNVLFYSDTSATLLTTSTDITTAAGAAFGTVNTNRPFLAKSEVEYTTTATISQHEHAYLQVTSQVDASGATYSNLRLTSIDHTRAGGTDESLDEAALSGACSNTATVVASQGGAGTAWPQTHMYCNQLMRAAGPLSNDVVPGDSLQFGLQWKLVNANNAPGSTGKAKLLQEAPTEAQSVEVSLTIQLGGGETTITTAGGSDGSSDPTVTYIIIAVCIVAAGLILAVVVVAFMCLRNRSQEQLVSMSPQKCTVAAVYDISQPKKADAMDV